MLRLNCLLYITLVCAMTQQSRQAPVDVALGKPITAEITCGFNGSEFYFGLDMEFVLPQNRDKQSCVDTNQHAAEFMVDGDSSTWWQSTSRTKLLERGYGIDDASDAVIVLDLQQTFQVEQITVSMGNAKRPGAMLLSRSRDGVTYDRWVYRVTSNEQCTQQFLTPQIDAPADLESVVCFVYSSELIGSLQNYEQVTFDLLAMAANLLDWRVTRFLKVEFFNMEIVLSPTAFLFHHYAVESIEVLAECECNGQNTDCVRVNDTTPYECVCGGFTHGQYCEQCLPFYNQQPYRQGQPCVECNCHEHSSVCVYDPVIGNLSRSLDANGEYSGGGRCLDCQHNTTGVNCEQCVSFYYRPLGVAQSSRDACVPCECEGPGVTINQATQLYGDCVMNNDTVLPDDKSPGDCFCKENVEGSMCDVCKPGFYNLTQDNPQGCLPCLCDTAGTVGGTEAVCEGDTGGQCPCKEFVMNRQCNECLDGYYDINAENAQGCVECNCDTGGSLDNICDKITGQCRCRESIGGRRCDGTDSGFYIPDLHFLSGEFEHILEWGTWDREIPGYKGYGYALATPEGLASTDISLPSDTQLSGGMYILLRHRSAQTTDVTITATQLSGLESSLSLTLAVCSDWCYVRSDSSVQLSMGEPLTLTVQVTHDILLDRAVALPIEFENTQSLLGDESVTFHATCDVINDDITSVDEVYCIQQILSISAFYLDGAQPCDCSLVGSVNADLCQEYGGQCDCRPGVTSRACDQCMIEYYGLTSLGCQACNCSTLNGVCDFMTGQCVCPVGTFGRMCDSCVANYWNWQPDAGCEYCGCSELGSLNLQCGVTDGSCTCKPGVGGAKCDTCQEGYTHLSVLGCDDCNCNSEGSLGTVCNVTTGQCPCKENVEGVLCNTCAPGSFYLDESHDLGCLECVCMGITNDCSATTWRTKTQNTALYTGQQGSRTTRFSMVSVHGEDLGLDVSVVQFNNFPVLQVQLSADTAAYWSNPALPSGNLLGLYGNLISFEVNYTPTLSTGTPRNIYVIIRGRDDVTYQLPATPVQADTLTLVEVKVTDSGARRLDGQPVTRGAFLFALSDVRYVMLPASLYNLAHTSRLILVQYQVAMADGLGQVVRSVEQCHCGEAYAGLSCQECAEGYRRVNASSHEYLGVCVACECNGHSDSCDPLTGVCLDCLHNTAGDNCDVCIDGYYGDATVGTIDDCAPCPCLAPRVINNTCDVINATVTCHCAQGYAGALCDQCDVFNYGNPGQPGGECLACDCHGNSQSCDPLTGACIDCGFNTTGLQCERCLDGWYGNASAQNCLACECDTAGSVSTLCNFTSGQCECLPGVGNRVCDTCLPNFYGYGDPAFDGCRNCECNEAGSATLQCDNQGVCICNDNTLGDKCHFCAANFYGLPIHACQACACDVVGSVDAMLECEPVSGQCQCKEGVAGRDCSQCDMFHTDLTTDGCTRCGECQFSLGNDTLILQDSWQTYWNDSLAVRAIEQEDSYMQTLSAEIERVSRDLGISSDRLNTLTDAVNQLDTEEPAYSQSVSQLLSQSGDLERRSRVALNSSVSQVERTRHFQQCANNALSNVNTVQASSLDTISQMTLNNQSANQLLELSRGLDVTSLNVSFDDELSHVREETRLVQETSEHAQAMTDQVQNQLNVTLELERAGYAAQTVFLDLQSPIESALDHVTSVQELLRNVQQHVTNTVQNRAYAESLISETESSMDLSEAIQRANQIELDLARQLFDEAHDIKEGTESNLPLPINTTLEFEGILSWVQGLDYIIDQLLPGIIDSVMSFNASIRNTESHATDIHNTAANIHAELLYVQPRGQAAVDAIDKFERVVTILQDSLVLAQQANTTIHQAMQVIETVSIEELKRDTENSVTYSETNLTHAQSYDNTASGFSVQFDLVNDTLEQTIAFWDSLSADIDGFNSAVDSIHNLVQGGTTAERISGLSSSMESINQQLDSLHADSAVQANAAHGTERDLHTLQEKVSNASNILTDIPNQLNTFQRRLDNDIQTSVDLATQSDIESDRLQDSIDAQIARLELAIQQARERLETLEQPVSLDSDTYLQMENPSAQQTLLYNEISVEFKPNSRLQGVILFVEKADTSEYLLLQIKDGVLEYGYGNVDQEVSIQSPVELCAGCWFRVLATRYGTEVKLTVTRLSTGGSATNYNQLESSTHQNLQLTTDLYVGGLPQDQYFRELSMIDYSQSQFDGCIYNLLFDDTPIPLWQTILASDSDAQCCRKPQVANLDPPTISGINIDGFGYIRLNYTGLEVHTQSHILMTFRTFSPNAVMFLADQENLEAYYGIFLEDGRVVVYAHNGQRTVVLGTERFYNDGEWYQMKVLLNSTYVLMHMELSRDGNMTTQEVISDVHSVNMSVLQLPHYTLGGQNPASTNRRGPVSTGYAGCIGRIETSVGSSDVSLVELNVQQYAVDYQHVDFNHCYEQVMSGLGLSETSSYIQLSTSTENVRIVEFELSTYKLNGIILYATLHGSGGFLYVALYHGDIFVLFDQGQGQDRQGPLRTRGLNLADGLLHSVRLDFSFINSPRLRVDGTTHYGALTMLAGMNIASNPIYIGGVSPLISLDETRDPVRRSLIGGIKDLTINLVPVNYFSLISASNQQGIYLSGIPGPPTTRPPLPYQTTEASPTTPQPVCGTSSLFTVSDSGARFGDEETSYIAYESANIDGLRDMLINAFAIKIEFRALQSDGVLFYMASSNTNPGNYFVLFMQGGFLYASMETGSNSQATKNLRSRENGYNDGNWWTVEALRLNEFMALVIDSNRDYINNGLDTGVTSTLEINTLLYVGGVDSSIDQNNPFTTTNVNMLSALSFHGCIRNVQIISHDFDYISLPLGSPDSSEGVSQCFEQVSPGVFINSTNSYVRVEREGSRTFSISNGFDVQITFRGNNINGTLLSAYRSQSEFFIIDIINGQICVVVANRLTTNAPLIVKSTTLNAGYSLCTERQHSLHVILTPNSLIYDYNSLGWDEWVFPSSYPAPSMSGMEVYAAGLKDWSWSLPIPHSATSFRGCIISIQVNEIEYNLAASTDTHSIFSGCPTPRDEINP